MKKIWAGGEDGEDEERRRDEVQYKDPGDLCQEQRKMLVIYWAEIEGRQKGEDANTMKDERDRTG